MFFKFLYKESYFKIKKFKIMIIILSNYDYYFEINVTFFIVKLNKY